MNLIRYQPLSQESHAISMSSLEPNRLGLLCNDLLKKIVYYLTPKDRYQFRQSDKRGLNIVSLCEIELIRLVFVQKKYYLDQILSLKIEPDDYTKQLRKGSEKASLDQILLSQINSNDYSKNLSAANKKAENLGRNHSPLELAFDQEIDPEIRKQILPDRYRTYASAILALEKQDEALIEFSSKAYPELDLDDELTVLEKADRYRKLLGNSESGTELSQEAFDAINASTPAKIVNWKMSNPLLLNLLKKLLDVSNAPAVFRLIESHRLEEEVISFDPAFVRVNIVLFERALRLAVENGREESVKCILKLTGRKILGSTLGDIEKDVRSREISLIFQNHANELSMGCLERSYYHCNKRPIFRDTVITIIVIGILVGAIVLIIQYNKK